MAEAFQFKRQYPRRRLRLPCSVNWEQDRVQATIADVSYCGVGVVIAKASGWTKQEARIEIPEGISLKVRPVYLQEESENHRIGCKIELIAGGKKQWLRLCDVPRW
ncbi:MAG: PilZ domain-containing protein [Nitrospirae bacterium]|nr:MAG: PilZ domain-containing protein [Nitrospirota bacterium]